MCANVTGCKRSIDRIGGVGGICALCADPAGGPLVGVGCADGWVRVFDPRDSPSPPPGLSVHASDRRAFRPAPPGAQKSRVLVVLIRSKNTYFHARIPPSASDHKNTTFSPPPEPPARQERTENQG